MQNQLAEPIWAWNLGIDWNPAVLQLQTVSEGPYLNAAPGLYDGSSTIFVVGNIDNIHGTIQQGISDVYLSNATTNAPSGVMANLTFQVIGYADSFINITEGIPTLMDNFGHTQSTLLHNAQYVSPAMPEAQAPTAVIHNQGTDTKYLANEPIVLDATGSTAGFDVIPDAQNPSFPIISYSWTQVNGPAVTGLQTTGFQANLAAPSTVGANFTIQLTVTTAPNSADPNYVNTASTTITFSPDVIPPTDAGPQIDLYIVNNPVSSAFPYKTNTSLGISNGLSQVEQYSPQQIMNLAAFVSFNGASVSDKAVTFILTPNGNPSNVIYSVQAYTNESGIAVAQYRLPNFNSAIMSFGNYTVTATVDVAQNVVSDAFWYNYGFAMQINGVTVNPAMAARARDLVTVNVALTNNALNDQSYTMTFTVLDCNSVPIYTGIVAGQTAPVGSSPAMGTFDIPAYAFAGLATVHVNLFNADPSVPSNNALPYCPEATGTFTIGTAPQ